LSDQPSIPESGRPIQGRARKARRVKQHKHSCAAGATHIRGIPVLRRVEPSSTYTDSLRRHVYFRSRFHPSTPIPIPKNRCAGPGHLYCVVQQRPRLAEQERDTFYTTKGQLSNRAIPRPRWTRNMRMSAVSHRLTRPRCSKKVLQPIIRGASEVNWRYGS
jgi:hypothetical protein